MTKTEAIQKLEMYKGVISDLINIIAESKGLNCFEFDTEPFDIAIEALKNGDVSEKAALSYAEGYSDGFLHGKEIFERR